MKLELIRLKYDRRRFLKEIFWRSFPIIWLSEKGRYGFENLGSWLSGLLFDFEGFLKGYYEVYIPQNNSNRRDH